jgi:hypothetical protein
MFASNIEAHMRALNVGYVDQTGSPFAIQVAGEPHFANVLGRNKRMGKG